MKLKLKNNRFTIIVKSKHGKIFIDKKGFAHIVKGDHSGCTTIREDLLYELYDVDRSVV